MLPPIGSYEFRCGSCGQRHARTDAIETARPFRFTKYFLNFNGVGFINRSSDLARVARDVGLDGFVVENQLYLRDQHITASPRDSL
ncbi:hypothetical protein [Pandoraea soli]|uniref:hypothetical protein n=1 Tax=Pandoraea soli TaxID=2508293 RepID=UPI00158445B6|nr:hypothetical protein [Pandoraea soli]